MSIADSRSKLTAALAGLGVDAVPYPPPVPSSGQGWPQWVMTEISTSCMFTHTWEVYVVPGGGDPASTGHHADALIERVADGLAAVGRVVQLEPVLLTLTDNQNGLPCIRARVETT